MFVQIHMLQSMPPGNLNRDDMGQPKKCLFGGVTRGRISSQCLKRNIRLSDQFREAFGEKLANRTQYLPQMVADAIQAEKIDVPDNDLLDLMTAIAGRFKKSETAAPEEDSEDGPESTGAEDAAVAGDVAGRTPQLVFFPQSFANRIAELVADMRKRNPAAYAQFLGRKSKSKLSKDETKANKTEIEQFVQDAWKASKSLTVDIAMFGRMTTSDLVENVDAACQVAHAMSTHEIMIESDYFTAMDDRKEAFATTQTDKAGAAFVGSGETETFFNSAVYYKYLNLDVDAVKQYLPSFGQEDAARAAAALVSAAALANPTGKQNNFAAHSVPELILVEVSNVKRPISYANAFLQPVEGGVGRNMMAESARALAGYIDSVASAYAPAETQRVLLAIGPAEVKMETSHDTVRTLAQLVESVTRLVAEPAKAKVSR